MPKRLTHCAVFATSLLVGACSSDGDSFGDSAASTKACDQNQTNQFVYEAMHSDYLWYGEVPTLDYTSYSDASSLLADLRFEQYDRFSYVMDQDDYEAALQSRITAFGFSLVLWEDRYIFSFIQPDSPMDKAGVRRGDELLQIADVPMSEMDNATFYTLLDTSTGPNTQQLIIAARDTSEQSTLTVTSAEFDVTTVYNQHERTTGAATTGYLGLSRFMSGSSDELASAFAQLKTSGVTDLVVDLRNNGGGLIRVAAELAGLIGGTELSGETFARILFNDKQSYNNTRYTFASTDAGLGLQRVILLTGPNTCSASEMIINGLSPFMEVVTIGDATCGKPIGMVPSTSCDKALFAINFEITNALNEGGYFDGLGASCSVTDLPVTDMWNESDALYAAALNYIVQGQCVDTKTATKISPAQTLTPKQPVLPDWDLF